MPLIYDLWGQKWPLTILSNFLCHRHYPIAYIWIPKFLLGWHVFQKGIQFWYVHNCFLGQFVSAVHHIYCYKSKPQCLLKFTWLIFPPTDSCNIFIWCKTLFSCCEGNHTLLSSHLILVRETKHTFQSASSSCAFSPTFFQISSTHCAATHPSHIIQLVYPCELVQSGCYSSSTPSDWVLCPIASLQRYHRPFKHYPWDMISIASIQTPFVHDLKIFFSAEVLLTKFGLLHLHNLFIIPPILISSLIY